MRVQTWHVRVIKVVFPRIMDVEGGSTVPGLGEEISTFSLLGTNIRNIAAVLSKHFGWIKPRKDLPICKKGV